MSDESISEKIAGANWEGNIEFLQKMIDEGQFDPLAITEEEHWNSLHEANIWNPSPKETIQFYLDHGVPINAQDCYGMTPLHYAVKLLLEAGAEPYKKNSYGISLLDSAKLSLMLKGGSSEVRSLIEKLVEKLEGNIPSDYVPKDFSYLNLGKK
jgi:ankyrin repeat protein